MLIKEEVSNCFQYVKDTNLKGNHNVPDLQVVKIVIVFNMSKIQI